jgi:peptidoglycan/LPS O-acetylase OafA/YrhL
MKWKFSLDFLRAMAILLVLFYHYSLPPIDYFGASFYIHIQNGFKSGVELFFVLSGFLISSHWFESLGKKKKLSSMMQDFYVKRTFRILPLYYLILLFEALRATYLKKIDYNLLSYLTLTQNIFGKTIFIVSWSLCVEEHFYLFFPISSYLFLYFKKIKMFFVFTISLFLLSLILRYKYFHILLVNPESGLYQNTIFILDGLITGVIIGYLFTFHELWMKELSKHLRLLELLGLLFFSMALYLSGSNYTFIKIIFLPSIFSIGYGLFVISANFDNSIFNKIYQNSFITITSKISYPLYLTHYVAWMLLEVFFKHLHSSLKGPIAFVVYFSAAFFLAWVLHQLVEKRFLKLRNRFLSVAS